MQRDRKYPLFSICCHIYHNGWYQLSHGSLDWTFTITVCCVVQFMYPYVKHRSQHQRKIQAGRVIFWVGPAPASAQSSLSHGVRAGCSGLLPAEAYNPPRLYTAQPPWASSPLLGWPRGQEASPYLKPAFVPLPLVLPSAPLWGAQLCLLHPSSWCQGCSWVLSELSLLPFLQPFFIGQGSQLRDILLRPKTRWSTQMWSDRHRAERTVPALPWLSVLSPGHTTSSTTGTCCSPGKWLSPAQISVCRNPGLSSTLLPDSISPGLHPFRALPCLRKGRAYWTSWGTTSLFLLQLSLPLNSNLAFKCVNWSPPAWCHLQMWNLCPPSSPPGHW